MTPRHPPTPPSSAEQGFTLLELIVVIAIIGILASIAMPALKDVPRRANEAVLRTDLVTFRDVIDQYLGDKGQYPPTLEALVEAGYLRRIPVDPITKRNDTWILVREDADSAASGSATTPPDAGLPGPGPGGGGSDTSGPGSDQPGIIDVHSGATVPALNGSSYSDW